MPLSNEAFPYVDPETGQTKVWDGDTSYEVDPSGQVITPGGVEVPWWGAPTGQQATPGSQAGGQTQPQAGNQLPGLNVQPGMASMQWEANYNLLVAAEKRVRELMETVTIPQARQGLDMALFAIQQQMYGNQVNARESQAKMSGKIPGWLPQAPQFKPGGWRGYQEGGLVTPPGTQSLPLSPQSSPVSDDVAAKAIWDNDRQLQSMYQQQHPEMDPVTAVKDWWGYSPHEGANSLGEYARKKGWA